MTHVDPILAAKLCTPAEQEVVRLRNHTPPMGWTTITQLTGRSRGQVKREWNSANRKVNGEHIPKTPKEKADEQATIRDPDEFLVGQGVPCVGTRGAIPGSIPGGHPRPWEIRHNRLDRQGR